MSILRTFDSPLSIAIGLVVIALGVMGAFKLEERMQSRVEAKKPDMVGLTLDVKAPGCIIADSKGNPIDLDSKAAVATIKKGSTFTGECLTKR